jgi:hypothetical protein
LVLNKSELDIIQFMPYIENLPAAGWSRGCCIIHPKVIYEKELL